MNPRDAKLPILSTSRPRPIRAKLAIDRVGIKSIRHPVKIAERSGGVQHTIAMFDMYVGLPHHFRARTCRASWRSLNAHEREISPTPSARCCARW